MYIYIYIYEKTQKVKKEWSYRDEKMAQKWGIRSNFT